MRVPARVAEEVPRIAKMMGRSRESAMRWLAPKPMVKAPPAEMRAPPGMADGDADDEAKSYRCGGDEGEAEVEGGEIEGAEVG